MAEPPSDPDAPEMRSDERSDRSRWNWLLVVPIIVPLLTFLYNRSEPRLFGFPLFYWLQLSFLGLSVICTVVVYRMAKHKKP